MGYNKLLAPSQRAHKPHESESLCIACASIFAQTTVTWACFKFRNTLSARSITVTKCIAPSWSVCENFSSRCNAFNGSLFPPPKLGTGVLRGAEALALKIKWTASSSTWPLIMVWVRSDGLTSFASLYASFSYASLVPANNEHQHNSIERHEMSKQHTHEFCQAKSDPKFAGSVFAIAFVKKVVNAVLFNLAHYKQRGQP